METPMTEISQTLERKTDREGKQTQKLRQADRQTGREKINRIDRQIVGKTHRMTDEDRRTNRQTDKRSYEWKV